MARKSLTDALRGDDESGPPFSAELAAAPRHPHEPAAPAAPAVPASSSSDAVERYKFTANMNGTEYDQLEALTAAVVAELAPRPVGKGWRAKVVRTLVALAADDPALRKRIVAHLRKTG